MRFQTLQFFSALLLAITFSACGQENKPVTQPKKQVAKPDMKDWNNSIPGNFAEKSTYHFDSTMLDAFLKNYPKYESYAGDMRKFYRGRGFTYAWFDKDGMIEQAGNLRNRIDHMDDEGLNSTVPYHAQLDSVIGSLDESAAGKPDLTPELMLTASYFAFAKIVWGGMDASVSKSMDWYLPRKKVSYANALDSLLKAPVGELKNSEPVYRQYEMLRTYLKRYRSLDSMKNWEPIKMDKKAYKPGDNSPVITAIRKRLYLLGDFAGDTASAVYSADMNDAVKACQHRLGLTEDGVIGNGMISELNITPQKRITQIMVNMERARWVPIPDPEQDYLVVNIPDYRLFVYQKDSLVWSCNVVVGKAMNKTVIFSGDVKYVVFSPYWNVPPSIVRKEVVPGMARNKNYIASHNMEITGRLGGLPVVRQKPGPNNSLGKVKFLFPNSYNIYLHDSPAKSLFNETTRAFSHGCIRVQEPEKLANFLLRNDSSWTPEKINAAMNAGKEQYVTLKKTVPVYIGYFTAFVDSKGKINFRKDIYSKDASLAKALMEN
ncbi:L,D-transpeptidase family protein [Taibaiella soli]|uniref:Murein L,D-transpeptidase n=1 Tax=Taibaiella soli TaxID=1649169 RepID=A0A2W2B426_9BACT|nr:L,D-transpeptidase family protein [Taibaiella soli]PZF74788.1 murein L,D-transpeptidase [Taibaiella soli]